MGEIWGLVLAGGKSSRMGQRKALLPFNGGRLIDSMVNLLAAATGDSSRVWISGRVDGYVCTEDEFAGRGPLEGLRCVLKLLPEEDIVVVVPVDMPRLTAECLMVLLKTRVAGQDFVRFTDSELPCALVVSRKMKASLDELCAPLMPSRLRSFKSLFSRLRGEEIRCPCPEVLYNANTPEEWQEIIK